MWLDNSFFKMNKSIIILISLILIIFQSCLDSYETEDCDYENCNTEYPDEGTMTVRVSLDNNNMEIPIEIYEGYYDNGILMKKDTIYSSSKNYFMDSEMYFTVKAEYNTPSGKISVIDGGRIRVKSRKECDSTCYSINNLDINVKRKY